MHSISATALKEPPCTADLSPAPVEDAAESMLLEAASGRRRLPRPFKATVQSLASSSFLRNVGVLSSGFTLGHLFTLAAGPLLTRIYSPSEFGALGLFTSFLSMVAVAATLQYEISIPIGRDEMEAAYLTFGSVLLAVPMGLVTGLVLWLMVGHSLLGFGSLPWYAPLLLGCSVAFIGFFSALRYWSLRMSSLSAISQGTVVQSAGRAILQTGLGALGLHSAGLLFGETLGRCVGMSKMLRSAWPALRRNASRFRWQQLGAALWRHRKFPIYSFPSSFLDALCLGMPLPLLIRMYGVTVGGYYSVVWKSITVPSVLITLAVADTFHGRLAVWARETPERVTELFRNVTLGLLAVGLVPALLIRFFGPTLFGHIFGSRWALSGTMAAIVAPWYLAQFVVSPLSRVVVVLSGQERKLLWDVLCLLSLAGVFLYAHWRVLPVLQTIRLLSWTYAGLFVVYYGLLLQIIHRFRATHASNAGVQPCAE